LTVDVETVVVGGGLSHLGDRLLRDVHEVLDEWAQASPFLASLSLPARVRLVPEGSPAAAIGAALVGES
jgi:predicted NBD/HSP70 family sugar kinase